jgi:hypothetical protein
MEVAAMNERFRWIGLLLVVLAAVVVGGCAPASKDVPTSYQSNCAADDPRVGQTAVLHGYVHGVQGTARIVDNCSIAIENFSYDGVGLDVRVVGVKDGNFRAPVPLTGNIRDHGPFHNETLVVPLPQGVTLDDVPVISILCVSFGIDYGDGTFE